MKADIRGIGVVGGFGIGIKALEEVLVKQEPTVESIARTDPQPLKGQPHVTADIGRIQDYLPARALRRIDSFSRMAVLAAILALKDADIPAANDYLGIIVATGYGASRTTFAFLDTAIEGGDLCASPTHFSGSVHNAAAAHVSMILGACGPNLTVSRLDMSMPDAVSLALQWLSEDRVESVLVGSVDEWCPVLGHCYHRFFGNRGNAPMTPLDPDRQSALIAEGAAFFLLSASPPPAPRYGFVESVVTGHLRDEKPPFPDDAFLLLGADGHRGSAVKYARWVPKERQVASYAPYYGSLPVGMGFDMAVASLMVARDRIFPMPSHTIGKALFNVVRSDSELQTRKVCCLKITSNDEYGMITLAKNADR